jgi:hypothetical protein
MSYTRPSLDSTKLSKRDDKICREFDQVFCSMLNICLKTCNVLRRCLSLNFSVGNWWANIAIVLWHICAICLKIILFCFICGQIMNCPRETTKYAESLIRLFKPVCQTYTTGIICLLISILYIIWSPYLPSNIRICPRI